MIDLKVINSVLGELEKTKGISKEKFLEALEEALGAAYRKEYGERGEIVKSKFNLETGEVDFFRVKEVIVPEQIISEEDFEKMNKEEYLVAKDEGKTKFIESRHIMIENAKLIKANAEKNDEITFDLEKKEDFGRIAAMTARQIIKQKIREAEKEYITEQFGEKIGKIISGQVVRVEGGSIFVDLGKTEGIIPFREQIKNENFKVGERIKSYLLKVDQGYHGGVEMTLSRTHPEFLRLLFEKEVPEIKEGLVEIKKIAREPGFRSKISVIAYDEELDPVGTFVGPGGSRVTTVSSELGGERIDIIEWSENPEEFIEAALSPAEILDIRITQPEGEDTRPIAEIDVIPDQFSLAIGKGGQNSRLAAKLTGYKININSVGGEEETEFEKTVVEKAENKIEIKDDIVEKEPEIEEKEIKKEDIEEKEEIKNKEKNGELNESTDNK